MLDGLGFTQKREKWPHAVSTGDRRKEGVLRHAVGVEPVEELQVGRSVG